MCLLSINSLQVRYYYDQVDENMEFDPIAYQFLIGTVLLGRSLTSGCKGVQVVSIPYRYGTTKRIDEEICEAESINSLQVRYYLLDQYDKYMEILAYQFLIGTVLPRKKGCVVQWNVKEYQFLIGTVLLDGTKTKDEVLNEFSINSLQVRCYTASGNKI